MLMLKSNFFLVALAHPVPSPPFHLIQEEDVREVLIEEKGSSAFFKSFQLESLHCVYNRNKFIFRVKVAYEQEGELKNASYIAKVYEHLNDNDTLNAIVLSQYRKEKDFHKLIFPRINNELEKINEPRLKVPTWYCSKEKEKSIVLFFQDLLDLGFKPYSNRKSLQDEHAFLIVKELAKLHAVSRIDITKNYLTTTEFTNCFACVGNNQLPSSALNCKFYLIELFINAAKSIASACKRYPNLLSMDDDIWNAFYDSKDIIFDCNEPFVAVTHGGQWVENFMFRYSLLHAISFKLIRLKTY